MNTLTEKLEMLIETQAMGLSDQHVQAGRAAAEQIRQEVEARLAQRCEGEELRFQQEAAQLCRQLLQGERLRVDADVDRLRWALVQEVLSGVREQLAQLPADPAHYRATLMRYLAEAAQEMPDGNLVAEVSARDAEWLRADWQQIIQAAPGREIALRVLDAPCTGGIRVCDAASRLRIDNTFEGRLARMESTLLSVIMQALFPETSRADVGSAEESHPAGWGDAA